MGTGEYVLSSPMTLATQIYFCVNLIPREEEDIDEVDENLNVNLNIRQSQPKLSRCGIWFSLRHSPGALEPINNLSYSVVPLYARSCFYQTNPPIPKICSASSSFSLLLWVYKKAEMFLFKAVSNQTGRAPISGLVYYSYGIYFQTQNTK